jgi:hypothetical protein
MVGIPKRKRSGGPRTEEGRSLASANSVKTGVYSSMIVLPNENEQDFLELQHQFVLDFMPHDVAELSMVHELAAILWKKLRLEKLEKSAFVRVLNEPVKHIDLYGKLDISERFNPYLANIEIFNDEFIANFEGYSVCVAKVGTNPGRQEFLSLCDEKPSLFHEIVEMAKEHYVFKLPDSSITPELIFSLEIESGSSTISFVNFALKEIKGKADDVLWIAQRLDKIKQAITNHKEARLLGLMQSQGVMRARDELSRSFYRTLSELRKQQQWRLKMTSIDVTPSIEE